jgi:hypothetical protein
MMTLASAFEPFLAYELLDDKMAKKLHDAMREHRQTLDAFVEDDEPDIQRAAEVMRSLERVENTYNDIANDIYRVPAIVHVAGETKEESNPENEEEVATVQRCSRCGSMLQFWFDGIMFLSRDGKVRQFEEEDTRWWDIGQQIAKQDAPGHIDLYPVKEGRGLERWETECADLSELEALFVET